MLNQIKNNYTTDSDKDVLNNDGVYHYWNIEKKGFLLQDEDIRITTCARTHAHSLL